MQPPMHLTSSQAAHSMIQVEVLNGGGVDDDTAAVIEEMAEEIRDALEGTRCVEHEEEPAIRLHVQGDDDVEIEVGGCCPAFKERVWKILDDMDAEPDETGAEPDHLEGQA